MNKMLRIGLILAALVTLSGAAKAEEESLRLRGTFCSATTSDGVWAFVFNQNDVFTNCATVDQFLASATRAPVWGRNRGYYLTQGWNQAVAQCGALRSYFSDWGAYALQRAFNYAQVIGGRGCLFEVYFW